MVVWGSGKNITLSYERMVNRSHSISFQAGFLELPRLYDYLVGGLITFDEAKNKWGVNLAFDYRFYLSKRNSRPAPDGVYLGPYLSYYGYRFHNSFTILNTDVIEDGKMHGGFDIINLGVSLGYQFVFWKRFTVDLLLFAPCMSMYSAKLDVEGNLSQEIIDKMDKEIVEKILSKFPVLGYLISNDGSFSTGYRLKFGMGFRYNIQLGFHF